MFKINYSRLKSIFCPRGKSYDCEMKFWALLSPLLQDQKSVLVEVKMKMMLWVYVSYFSEFILVFDMHVIDLLCFPDASKERNSSLRAEN